MNVTSSSRVHAESHGKVIAIVASLRNAINAIASCRHGPDFRSVVWWGENYTFTAAQAAAVAILWEAWENGTPDVGQETLTSAFDTRRLRSVFQGHPAWGVMIAPGPVKGSYRLAEPGYVPPPDGREKK